tara:strand:+ start:186 stop:578 length:393 start_codon:yes stop_codon:yes gene_type:complete
MSHFVRVVNDAVTQVWDTQPPSGEEGWRDAVEVHPDIIDKRQVYTGHTFDLTTDPVQIVYNIENISVDDRKINEILQAKGIYQEVVLAQTKLELKDGSGNPSLISTAKDVKDASITAINNCTTHDELDAL